jgi:hypothetical protein
VSRIFLEEAQPSGLRIGLPITGPLRMRRWRTETEAVEAVHQIGLIPQSRLCSPTLGPKFLSRTVQEIALPPGLLGEGWMGDSTLGEKIARHSVS